MKKLFVVTAYKNDSFSNYLVGVYDNYFTAYIEALEEEKFGGYVCEIISIEKNKKITDTMVVKPLESYFANLGEINVI